MISVRQLRSWVNLLENDEFVYIDEDGLTLVLDKEDEDVYIEVGGKPVEDADEGSSS